MYRIILIIICFSTYVHASGVDHVRYVDSKKYPDPKQSYFIDLLTLTLEASKAKYGEYKIEPVSIEMAQARTSIMLQREEYIDLTWRMTSQQLENQLQAVYFPILKGLMGYRIFIITKDKKHLFNKNTSLQDLQKLPLGQGSNWPDTEILLANGFVVTQGYDNFLVNMLKKERIFYFPRALHEPWLEIKDDETLIVEENLMLHYPAPTFFFVNKKNTHLHQRLTFGLMELQKSGAFDTFFNHHKITSGILSKANAKERTVYNLPNPLLSIHTKELLKDKNLWIDLK